MANGDDSIIHLVHTIWSAALSAFGGLVIWNWNRLSKQVDEKVDKGEIDQLREDMRARWLQQDQMQKESRERLDAIYSMLARRGRRS